MVVRLSELLDRIRPAGAPGAPTDTEPQRELAASEETASLTRAIAELEAEADEIVADARARADSIRVDGERAARRVRSELAERVAIATAEAADEAASATTDLAASITSDSDAQVEELWATADPDRLAADIVDLIWRSVAERAS